MTLPYFKGQWEMKVSHALTFVDLPKLVSKKYQGIIAMMAYEKHMK
jgi:hypothetical protein